MKSNMVKDSISLSMATIVQQTISLAQLMILARIFTKQQYGTYSQMFTIITLASVLLLGIPQSISYFIVRSSDSESKQKTMSNILTATLMIAAVAFVLIIIGRDGIAAYFSNEGLKESGLIIAVITAAGLVSGIFANTCIAVGRALLNSVSTIVFSALRLVSVLIMLFVKLSFLNFLIIYACVELAIASYVVFMINKLFNGIKISFDRKLFREILVFSVPLGLASFLGIITLAMDKLIIGRQFTTEQFAIFTNGAKEVPVYFLVGSITAVMLPQVIKKFKDGDMEGVTSLWRKSMDMAGWVIVFFIFFLMLMGPEYISIMYSNAYMDSLPVFKIYLLALFSRITYFGTVLQAAGKSKSILWNSLATLVMNLILNLLLIKPLGIVGPAVATVLSIWTMSIVQLLASARQLGKPLLQIFPGREMLGFIAVNGVIYVLFWFLKTNIMSRYTIHPLISLGIVGLAWGGIYALVYRKRLKMIIQRIIH